MIATSRFLETPSARAQFSLSDLDFRLVWAIGVPRRGKRQAVTIYITHAEGERMWTDCR
jgi:hypothetical protein